MTAGMAFTEFILGFKAFDAHELLVHFVAESLGLYRQGGLRPRLLDTTFIPDDQLPQPCFLSACGSALISRLRGHPFRVISVTTDRPMFWLVGREGMTLDDLRGQAVATYPPVAPPALFLRIILKQHGLDPDRDVRLEVARDDTARLGLLRAGQVAAAVLSSATPPPLARRLGVHPLLFFGDHLRIPTSGLAVHSRLLEEEAGLTATLSQTMRQSRVAIHNSRSQVVPVLLQLLNCEPFLAEQVWEELQGLVTRDGKTSRAIAEQAVRRVGRELGVSDLPRVEEIYTPLAVG